MYRHEEYRDSMIEHLVNVSLRHWDMSMRELAAQSLHRILLTGFSRAFHHAFIKSVRSLRELRHDNNQIRFKANLLNSIDIYDLHGGLLALAGIAKACESHFSGSERSDGEKDRVRDSLNWMSNLT